MSRYDIIPAVMLAVVIVAMIATLINRRKVARGAVFALLALFGLGLLFQEPTAPEFQHLHPFPLVLAVLMVGGVLILAAALFGATGRLFLRLIRPK